METKEVQTMLRETKDVGVSTDRTPMGAVIIQKEKEKKKKSKMQKKQIKSIPNAVPSQEQQFRIFQNIDYPYMMRNVEIQNEEDKMVRALREVFGIKEKTPEMIADEALEKSVIKGRSYPIYTDEELTQQERRAREINSDSDLRKLAGVSGLFDDEDRDAPSAFNASVDNYMSYLADFRREIWGEESKPIERSRGIVPKTTYPGLTSQDVDYIASLMNTTAKSNQVKNFNQDMEEMRAKYTQKIQERMPIEISSPAPTFKIDMKKLEKELNKRSTLGRVYPRTIEDIKYEFQKYDIQTEKRKQPSLLAEEDIFAGMEFRPIQQEEDIVKQILSRPKPPKTQKETGASTGKSYRGKPLEEPLLAGERIKRGRGRPKGSLNKSTYEGMLNL
jgi:hypothetical protein